MRYSGIVAGSGQEAKRTEPTRGGKVPKIPEENILKSWGSLEVNFRWAYDTGQEVSISLVPKLLGTRGASMDLTVPSWQTRGVTSLCPSKVWLFRHPSQQGGSFKTHTTQRQSVSWVPEESSQPLDTVTPFPTPHSLSLSLLPTSESSFVTTVLSHHAPSEWLTPFLVS